MPIVHPLDPDDPAIFVCAQAGCQECLSCLLRRHEGLVVFIIARQAWNGLPFADLKQEGLIALWRAICRFDPRLGAPFSSFAWVAVERQLWRVTRCERRCRRPLPILDPPDAYLELEQALWVEQVRQRLAASLSYLTQRQRQVIGRVYGIGEGGTVLETACMGNLAAAGRQLGISRERVRQLRNQALSILRLPALSLPLRRLAEQDSRDAYLHSRQLTRQWLRKRGTP